MKMHNSPAVRKESTSPISTPTGHTDFSKTCPESLIHRRVTCLDEQCFEQNAAFTPDFLSV